MRLLTVAAIWALATAAALAVAWKAHVGVVMFTLSDRHGVHTGDLAAFAVAYAWATVLSLAVLSGRRPRR